MDRSFLHVQNIFDALNPSGSGVNGSLKLKCMQLQNRVISLANSNDIVLIDQNCEEDYVDYILNITKASNVLTLRYQTSRDLRMNLNSNDMFNAITKNYLWEKVLQRNPSLSPYIFSPTVCQAARNANMKFLDDKKFAANEDLVLIMNDKALFHEECSRLNLPVPRYWTVDDSQLPSLIIDLLHTGYSSLYIRQTRSGGALGNLTVEKCRSLYRIPEMSDGLLTEKEFKQLLYQYSKTNFWNEFIITELLDLHASPGTLFYSDTHSTTIISHTSQILNCKRSYLGFIYPITDWLTKKHFDEIEKHTLKLVEPWRKLGFRGYGNIDWMVDKNSNLYLAERNARQTAVIPPIKIENSLRMADCNKMPIASPQLYILTRDTLNLPYPTTFKELYLKLKRNGLVGQSEGVIITIPPLPSYGINTVGILVYAFDFKTVYEILLRVLKLFNITDEEWLFRL
ncbi:hypothetical protein [Dethiobacter alkaliphilus]|uniref:hypothetical protein n=1 Tax=Dethiobacter alkaliphilus TaxID=427926 RepID=UPI00222650FF|nr:hypothetical protein [Dethiobacter alkaliphilus]MCW3490216.1 hypothetical protein [Dethiobacter alkaliphilus]